MTKSHIKKVGLVLIASQVIGCTSYEKRQLANGDFKYLNEKLETELLVPDDLKHPDYSDEFEIPDVGEHRSEALGDGLSVNSPNLVLPIISGTHLDEGSKLAKVTFEKINDEEALDTTIWNTVIGFLEDKGIGVSEFDKEKQELVTDWIINEESRKKGILGLIGLNSEHLSDGSRFKFNFELRPHGRSGDLRVELIDHLETIDDEVIENNPLFLARNAEIEVLNNVLLHYDYQARLSQARTLREVREGVDIELGFSTDGHPAFLASAKFEVVWARLLLVIQELGFSLSDVDQSNGLLYVEYGEQEGGWWSNLWGRRDKKLPLDDGSYQFKVTKNEEQMTISMFDGSGKPLSPELIDVLFPEFSRVMATGRLGLK